MDQELAYANTDICISFIEAILNNYNGLKIAFFILSTKFCC